MILLSFFIANWKKWKPSFSASLPSYFHLHRCSSVQQTRATLQASRRVSRIEDPNCQDPTPDVSSLVKQCFIEVLPLRKWCCCSAVVTLTSHTLWICVTSQPMVRICLCPAHITGQMYGGKQQTHYGDLVNDMKVGFCLFSFIAPLAVCFPGFG